MFIWLIQKTSPAPLCVAVISLLLGIPFFVCALVDYAPPDTRAFRSAAGVVVRINESCYRASCNRAGVDIDLAGASYSVGFKNCVRALRDVSVGDRVTVHATYDEGQAYAVERGEKLWCEPGEALGIRATRLRIELYLSSLAMLIGLTALSRSFFGRFAESRREDHTKWSPRLPSTPYLRGDDKYEIRR